MHLKSCMFEDLTISFFFFLLIAGGTVASVRRSVYEFNGNQNEVVQVGTGNLKLIYSQGKLAQYVNSKSMVKY